MVYIGTNSKYLWIKERLYKRILRWLYIKYINEPFFPEGKVNIFFMEKDCCGNQPQNSVTISFKPEKFVPGVLNASFWDGITGDVDLWKAKEYARKS